MVNSSSIFKDITSPILSAEFEGRDDLFYKIHNCIEKNNVEEYYVAYKRKQEKIEVESSIGKISFDKNNNVICAQGKYLDLVAILDDLYMSLEYSNQYVEVEKIKNIIVDMFLKNMVFSYALKGIIDLIPNDLDEDMAKNGTKNILINKLKESNPSLIENYIVIVDYS